MSGGEVMPRRLTRFMLLAAVCGLARSTTWAQAVPPNDECSGAIAIGYGTNGPYTNVAATDSVGAAAWCGYNGSPGYRDVWFTLTATTCGELVIDTCNGPSSTDTIIEVYDACGSGPAVACNDDAYNEFGACGFGSKTQFFYTTIGTSYVIRVSSWLPTTTGSFPIHVAPATFSFLQMYWLSPSGPGSLMAHFQGPQNATYFLAITVVAGAYPYGWLFGLDISYSDLAGQLAAGFPFVGPLGPCGELNLGPFQGLPSGLKIYSVAFALPAGTVVPSFHTQATSYTIP
jgi:hypothetical protein